MGSPAGSDQVCYVFQRMNNPTGLKRETRSEWQKRAGQRQTVIHDVMPRTLTWPSGVSFFSRLHSPYWPLLPPSLDLSGPFKHKVTMPACVMNPAPDPEGARRGPTPGWQEAWSRCTIWLTHAARVTSSVFHLSSEGPQTGAAAL